MAAWESASGGLLDGSRGGGLRFRFRIEPQEQLVKAIADSFGGLSQADEVGFERGQRLVWSGLGWSGLGCDADNLWQSEPAEDGFEAFAGDVFDALVGVEAGEPGDVAIVEKIGPERGCVERVGGLPAQENADARGDLPGSFDAERAEVLGERGTEIEMVKRASREPRLRLGFGMQLGLCVGIKMGIELGIELGMEQGVKQQPGEQRRPELRLGRGQGWGLGWGLG